MARLCRNTGSYKPWPFKLAYLSGHTGILKTWEFVMEKEHVTYVFYFFLLCLFENITPYPTSKKYGGLFLFLKGGFQISPHNTDTVI